MRVNSPIRISRRRAGALQRRIKDVARWQEAVNTTTEDLKDEFKAKLECAQQDIAALNKKGIK
jgi:hypothetical protein